MMSMSTARRAMPSSRMRAPSLTRARIQRSTISSGEILRCGMPASAAHLPSKSATSGSGIARRFSSYLYQPAPVFGERLPCAGRFQMPIFFADPPPYVQSGQIARRQRAHRHAEVVKRPVNRFDACALFYQKLRLAAVGPEHAVSHKPAAVAHQNADLAELLGELHAGCDDLFAAGLATHNFEQAM